MLEFWNFSVVDICYECLFKNYEMLLTVYCPLVKCDKWRPAKRTVAVA